jgi:hypothetical protein
MMGVGRLEEVYRVIHCPPFVSFVKVIGKYPEVSDVKQEPNT